jgi:hypothetical protein
MIASGSAAAEESAAEISVKAVVVHKIAKFVSWPDARFDANDARLRLCVIGDRAVLDAFEALSERPIQGRALQVVHAPAPSDVAESCEVLFLGADDERAASEWLEAVAGHPVLTFGNAGAYGAEGSIVTMTIRRNKVRFAINLEANEDTGLRISAQLLQLAAAVGKPGG